MNREEVLAEVIRRLEDVVTPQGILLARVSEAVEECVAEMVEKRLREELGRRLRIQSEDDLWALFREVTYFLNVAYAQMGPTHATNLRQFDETARQAGWRDNGFSPPRDFDFEFKFREMDLDDHKKFYEKINGLAGHLNEFVKGRLRRHHGVKPLQMSGPTGIPEGRERSLQHIKPTE